MTIKTQITLDLISRQAPLVVHAVQYDENIRQIEATLTESGVPLDLTGMAAEFRMTKPDGTYVFYDSDEQGNPAVTISGSTVTVTLVAAALQAAGDGKAQIDIYDGDGKASSFMFMLRIHPSTVPDDAISDTYVNALTAIADRAVLAAQSAEESAEAAAQAMTSYVPLTRTVNNKALSADITLAASDVGAVPTSRTVNNKALSEDITLSASDVSAVPTSRTVNGKALSADITLSASDVGAVSSTTTVGTIGFTHSTEVTSGNSYLRKQGNVVMFYLQLQPDSTVNNNAFLNSFITLPTGFRPAKTTIIQSEYPNDKDIRLYLQSSGACNLYNASGAAIDTTQQLIFRFTFVG